MAVQEDPTRGGSEDVRQQTGTGRLANTSEKPGDVSAHPRVETPVGRPAEEVAQEDASAQPATADGGRDSARIVPAANQGDSAEVTDRIVGGEAGETVY